MTQKQRLLFLHRYLTIIFKYIFMRQKAYKLQMKKVKRSGQQQKKNLSRAMFIQLKQKVCSSLGFCFVTYGFIQKEIRIYYHTEEMS